MSTEEEFDESVESDESEEVVAVESRSRQALLDMWEWIGEQTNTYLLDTRMDLIYRAYCSYCHQQGLDVMPRQSLTRALHSVVNFERAADVLMGIYDDLDAVDDSDEEDDEDEDQGSN